MRAAVALLVAIGWDLIVSRYQLTNRNCWKDDDDDDAGAEDSVAFLGFRKSCLKREKRAGRWSQVAV